jgi:hypothetical protein
MYSAAVTADSLADRDLSLARRIWRAMSRSITQAQRGSIAMAQAFS